LNCYEHTLLSVSNCLKSMLACPLCSDVKSRGLISQNENELPVPYSAFGKYSDPFSTFCYFSLILKLIKFKFSSSIYTQYAIMTKRKQIFRFVCEHNKLFIYISIRTLCYETQNWGQVHPVSIDHPWDVSTTWLLSTCKFNWLDMIWKGTHLSI
jgi:hypothetical protein